jgi:2-haloalkanoic acid dehalogenase, type II
MADLNTQYSQRRTLPRPRLSLVALAPLGLLGVGVVTLLTGRRKGSPEVLLFDVNETLLDTRALDPYFERMFGTAAARERWFKEVEGLMLSTVATGRYRDFPTLAEAALHMSAEKDRIDVSTKDRTELLERMTTLPPYPDTAPALAQLKNAGLRLVALTNGTLKSTRAQLEHAQLAEFFEEILSADEVQCYKPGPAPYHLAAERLNVSPKEICLVAAHAWDIAGAQAAGLKTAFIARPRKVLDRTGARPDLEVSDLLALSEHISPRSRKIVTYPGCA